MIYAHLVELDEPKLLLRNSQDEKEAGELIDNGLSYVCATPQDTMLFQKRK
jgi:hypothetical protein